MYSITGTARGSKKSQGNHAKVPDMTSAKPDGKLRAANMAGYHTDSDSPTVRICSAVALRILRDRSFISELRKTLRDAYKRQDGTCTRVLGTRMSALCGWSLQIHSWSLG